ncbi:MAG TPA: hypothetical protein VNH18_07490, partial [Bryobacteraceae bacterium]|nr:hypothetical protein [Bryobacteraceae bacterium]
MKIRTIGLLLLLAAAVFGGYTYYYTDALTSINGTNWTQNGSLTATSGGLTSTTANGGSLIYIPVQQINPNGYEVKTTLTLSSTAGGGTYVTYLRATSNAISGPAPNGTYYSVELQDPTGTPTGSATLSVYKRVSGVITTLGTTTVSRHNGMTIRAVSVVAVPGNGSPEALYVYVDNIAYFAPLTIDGSIPSGQPGIGIFGITPSGSSISNVQIGPQDVLAPGQVQGWTVGTSVFPTRVDMQWRGVVDDSAGIGLWRYVVIRSGFSLACNTPECSDEAVAASTAYTYTLYAQDWHGNYSTGTPITVTTPPAGAIDPRRVGLRPTGSYWGAAGEQIDTLSGNLNFTMPLFKAMGRGGWGVNFALSYNSQLWRLDGGGTWRLGRDDGYGLGWRLMAGSVTPYWNGYYSLDHFIFADATGAEYRLDINANGAGVWTSSEGIYVSYDSNTKRLYFPDGTFWVMGCTSWGWEQDAGTLYPTQMQDTNGNLINVRYGAAVALAGTSNTSSRITEVEDVRAVLDNSTGRYRTYSFTYNADSLPHLTGIANYVGTAENYTLTPVNEAIQSPFSPP